MVEHTETHGRISRSNLKRVHSCSCPLVSACTRALGAHAMARANWRVTPPTAKLLAPRGLLGAQCTVAVCQPYATRV